MTQQVQSVFLSKEYFKTLEEAKRWMAEHNYEVKSVSYTEDYFRFPIRTPTIDYRYTRTEIEGGKGYLVMGSRK